MGWPACRKSSHQISFINLVSSNDTISIIKGGIHMSATFLNDRVILQCVSDGLNKEQEIVLADNMGLIYSYARRYDPIFFQDIVQEACIGLLTAAQRYDADKGAKFTTYATFWINQAVHKAYHELKRDVRLPSTTQDCINRINIVITKFMTENHRTPTSDEISEMTGINHNKVEYYQQISKETTSLDDFCLEDAGSFMDMLEDKAALGYQDELEKEGFDNVIHESMNLLTEKERRVIELHFGFGDNDSLSLADIGRLMGISRERARQLKDQALVKIRKSEFGEQLKAFI